MSVPDLTVILPSFNAGHFIAKSVTALTQDLAAAGIPHEILVIDDGSGDDTHLRLAGWPESLVAVWSLSRNRGKGAAIKYGFERARAANVVFTDADLPYGTEAVVRCYQMLRSGHPVVIGDRTLSESRLLVRVPWIRRLLSSAYLWLMRVLKVNTQITDTQCGLKGFSAKFAELVLRCSQVDRFSFDLELIVIADVNAFTIKRLPVELRVPPIVSARIFAESARMFVDLFRIARNRRRGVYRTVGASQPA